MKLWQVMIGCVVGCSVVFLLVGFFGPGHVLRSDGNSDKAVVRVSKDTHLAGKIERFSHDGGDWGNAFQFTISGTRKIFVVREDRTSKKKFPHLDLVHPGDEVVVEYKDDGQEEILIQHFDVTDSTKLRMFGIPLPPDVSPIAGQEHLLDPSSSTAYKHIPGSLGYLKPSSLGPEFPPHEQSTKKAPAFDPTLL